MVGGKFVLVLTNIYHNGSSEIKQYRHPLYLPKTLYSSTSSIYISLKIRDTDTGKSKIISIEEAINSENILDIFGVFKTSDDFVFIAVDIRTWLLMDYVDKIEVLGVVECDKDLLMGICKVTEFIERKDVSAYSIAKYNCSSGVVYTFKLLNDYLSQLDELGIFWMRSVGRCDTFYYFFQLLNLVDSQDCIAFYVSDKKGFTVKFNLNKNIHRLLAKFAVMKDKLHW